MSVSARQVSIVISFINRSQGALGGLINQLGEVDGKITKLNGTGLTKFGATIAGVGVAMGAVAVKSASVMNDMAKDYANYQKQVKGTMTQVEKESGYTYDSIYKMGMDYAKRFPVPFESVQEAIYDIFSSVEVTSKGQAEKYMDVITKSTVGGLTTMETAGRSTITLVNAFGDSLNVMGSDGSIAVDKVTHAGDIMFQTVRKGIGSYDEFATAFGKSAASAKTAGQSIETLGAMLAFMTRNGEPAARAGTSVARAMDMITKPNTIARFKQIGVNVTDSSGSFRQMSDIVKDLNSKFKNMSTEEYTKNLYSLLGGNEKAIKGLEKFGVKIHDAKGKLRSISDILKDLDSTTKGMSDEQVVAMMDTLGKGSGGTIQAMRFFKHAITDTNGSLDQMIGYMGEASNGTGALEEAFQHINETDSSKLERFNNLWQAIKISFGETFSRIKVGIAEALLPLLQWFDNLDPKTKDLIAKIAAGAVAILGFGGAVSILSGGFLMSVGAIQKFSSAIGGVGKVIQILIGLFTKFTIASVVIAGLIALGVLLYQNWDTVKEYAQKLWDKMTEVWNGVKEAMQPVVDFINDGLEKLGAVFNKISEVYGPMFQEFWESIKSSASGFIEKLTPWLSKIQEIFDMVADSGKKLWEALKSVFTFIGGAIAVVGVVIMELVHFFSPVINFVLKTFGPVFGTVFGMVLAVIKAFVGIATSIFNTIVGVIKGVADFLIGVFTGDWQKAWDGIKGIFVSVWEGIKGIFTSIGGWVYDFVKGLIDIVGTVLTNGKDAVFGMLSNAWEMIKTLFNTVIVTIITTIGGFVGTVLSTIIGFLGEFVSVVASGIGTIAAWFASLGGKIWAGLGGIGKTMYATASGWIKSMGDALGSAWTSVASWFGNLGSNITSALGNVANLLYDAGKAIIDGLFRGLKSLWENVKGWISGIADWIAQHKGPKSYDLKLLVPAGGWIMTGLMNGMKASLPALRDTLNGISGEINDHAFASPNIGLNSTSGQYAFGSRGFGGATVAGNGGSVTNVSAPITVNVDSPSATAEEIAAKLGHKVTTTVWV